jgi:hypothetical protein
MRDSRLFPFNLLFPLTFSALLWILIWKVCQWALGLFGGLELFAQ